MKQFLKTSFCVCIFINAFILPVAGAPGGIPVPEIPTKLRAIAAQELLVQNPQYKSIFVKGLICSSCGIGLRIHLNRVDGIDRKQLNRGVDMNIDTQLVTIAIEEGKSIDMSKVNKAIYKAGYDPVYYYEMSSAGMQRIDF
ncbi:MAG: heavy-metal-associated domain-containing protein [Verrucomicrobiota bacterium]